MILCTCEPPNPPKNAAGKVKGNVCQTCQGKIDPSLPRGYGDPIGRVMTAVQGAVAKLEFQSEDQRARYLCNLADSFDERLRQNFLTWKANDRVNSQSTKPQNA